MKRARWRRVAVLLLVGLQAGCGADEDGPAQARTATTPPGGTTAPAPTGTVTQPAPQGKTGRMVTCLTKEGYRLQGGETGLKDPDKPGYEIIFSSRRGGGFIGFYENAARATRVAAQLRKNASRIDGAATERRGAINIVWVDLPDPAARARVRACLVT